MIKMVIALKRREGMTHDEFTHYQRNIHRPLLMSIPEAEQYIRRFVVSYPVPAPNYPEPDYDSVVEAWFDTMDDLNAFYFCENFLKNVDPDHENFIDVNAFGRIISEEEVVIG
ncbi:EthD family reductase [Streptomyces sp. RS10V-4]|uniref:EthD domain-containing protein n=1 Tax=Streptomyces rhizoryzae TaxID=2932493 RepID=UPI002006B6A0|nr:EthD domain-containing protein [Streptomyces rhizoryzae]MCK7625191.1 EthD family reductase [Streptomyces rhizoryzae]